MTSIQIRDKFTIIHPCILFFRIYVCGSSNGDLIPGSSTSTQNAFVAQIDSNDGDVKWTVAISLNVTNIANGIAVDSFGDIFISGTSTGEEIGSSDAFIAKFDQSGAKKWEKQFGTKEDDFG
jgi:hypothetical protein